MSEYISITREGFQEILHAAAESAGASEGGERFTQIVDALSDTQKNELLGIMWLGRGDLDEWKNILSVHESKTAVPAYFLSKRPLVSYLELGWQMIPDHVKAKNLDEYKQLVYPKIVKPTTEMLDGLIQRVEEIDSALDCYLDVFQERPNISDGLLQIMYISDKIFSFVSDERNAISSAWYHEKTQNLKSSATYVVGIWLSDHSKPMALNSPLNRAEWIKETMSTGLDGVRSYANVLRRDEIEDGINLMQVSN